MTALTEQEAIREPGECIIRVDGEEIVDLYPHLRQASIVMDRSGATVCELEFETFRDGDDRWRVQDSPLLRPWKAMVIEAVFGDRNEEVMRGYIREVRLECPDQMGEASVRVCGQDESLLLDREHVREIRSTSEAPVSDGDLASRIAADYGLECQSEPGLSNAFLAQDATPVRFLRDRAEANGFELYIREGVLHFEPPDLEGDPQPTIQVYGGDSSGCRRFSLSYDGHRPDRVTVTRAAATGTGDEELEIAPGLPLLGDQAADSENAGLAPFTWRMEQPLGSSFEEARSRAQAKADENAWKVRAEGALDGVIYGHVLLTHRTVQVEGIGPTYDGLYFVDYVRHVFNAEGYQQSFRLLRNATG
jgi:hypothetical protein